MDHRRTSIWAERLTAIAAPALDDLDLSDLRAYPENFRDELGQQRPVDGFLVAAALEIPPPASPQGPVSGDVGLWAAMGRGSGVPAGWLRSGDGGPLLDHRPRTTIEVVTETELCALHALWSLARAASDARVLRRCLAAAAWHAQELQPDNATNLPWAIQVFVALAAHTGDEAADVEAQTRLHNALAGRARPDRRAALILHHAAAELRAMPSVGAILGA